MSIDHSQLFELVGKLAEQHDIHHLRWCIQECHNGRLHRPITPENLHLFRRYRNDPEHGSGDAKRLINDALAYPIEDWRYEVANGDTVLGYADWIDSQRELSSDDEEVVECTSCDSECDVSEVNSKGVCETCISKGFDSPTG